MLCYAMLSHFSRVRLCATPQTAARPWDSPGKNTGVGCHFLLQCIKVKSESEVLSHVQLFTTPWTAAHQAPLSMGFSRQEYWSGVPLPSPAISLKGILFLILTNTGCRGRYYHWLWQPGIRDAKYPASAGQPCTIKKKKKIPPEMSIAVPLH